MENSSSYLLCVSLITLGFVVRDGWPVLGHTNRSARPVGGFLCGLGGMALFNDYVGVAIGVALFISFFLEQKHGEGQRARDWSDMKYLAISGVTLVALPTAVLMSLVDVKAGFLGGFLGLVLKPVIWWVSWRVRPSDGWWQPTRVAAIQFGIMYGMFLCLASLMGK